MKYTLLCIGILIVTISISKAQTRNNDEFQDLMKNYAFDSLPYCVNFSEDTKSSIEAYSFEINQDEEFVSDEDSINNILVRKFFFAGKNTVCIQNLWSRDSIGMDSIDNYLKYNKIYLTSVIIRTKKFVGIVFNREETEGTEIYFCTFNKGGELLSKVQLGFYMHSGSYTNEEGGRNPWYAEKIGCINKNYLITTDDSQSNPIKYQILDTGKIKELK